MQAQVGFSSRFFSAITDSVVAVGQARDKGVVVLAEATGTGSDLMLVKHTAQGGVIWATHVPDTADQHPVDLIPIAEEGFLAMGWTAHGNGKETWSIWRFNEAGTALNASEYAMAGHQLRLHNAAINHLGHILMVGEAVDTATGQPRAVAARLDANGNVVWAQAWDSTVVRAAGVAPNTAGAWWIALKKPELPLPHWAVCQLETSGSLLTSAAYRFFFDSEPHRLAVLSDGNIAFGGSLQIGTGEWAAGLLVTDPTGNPKWVRTSTADPLASCLGGRVLEEMGGGFVYLGGWKYTNGPHGAFMARFDITGQPDWRWEGGAMEMAAGVQNYLLSSTFVPNSLTGEMEIVTNRWQAANPDTCAQFVAQAKDSVTLQKLAWNPTLTPIALSVTHRVLTDTALFQSFQLECQVLTGTEEAALEEDWAIWPQPATGWMNIEPPRSMEYPLAGMMLDSWGREAMRFPLHPHQIARINTAGLANGLYGLLLTGPEGTVARRKVLVQH